MFKNEGTLLTALKITVALLLVSVFVLVKNRAQTISPSAIQDLIENQTASENVFRILAETESGGIGGGTGYMVNTEEYGTVILTNKHICDMNPPNKLFVLDQDNGIRYLTVIKRKAKKTDLCLLETPQPLIAKHKGLTLAPKTRKLQFGEELYVYGHPSLRPLTGSHGKFINETYAAITETEREYVDADHIEIGRANIPIYPGSSGSPVLDEEGLVVGTIFAFETDSHIGLLIPIKEMHEFLEGEL
jgi:S1-C subfamily serine protease